MAFQTKEIIRIIATVVLVATIVFLLQPNLYTGGLISITDKDVNTWVTDKYTTSAVIVFLSALLPTGLWAILAGKAKARPDDVRRWSLLWWILLLIPVIGVCGGIFLACDPSNDGASQEALLSLTGLFVLDILLLFWLSTAMNTPGNLRYGAVPFSFLVRKLIGE